MCCRTPFFTPAPFIINRMLLLLLLLLLISGVCFPLRCHKAHQRSFAFDDARCYKELNHIQCVSKHPTAVTKKAKSFKALQENM